LYIFRQMLARLLFRVHRRMMRAEESRFLVGPLTISSQFNSRQRNAEMWNRHDWSRRGEEWTDNVRDHRGLDPEQWKQRLVRECLQRFMPASSVILEVGPGGGRWTEYLLLRARRLILVDVAERCLELCRERFDNDPRLSYVHAEADPVAFIPPSSVSDGSVDAIWSYDAFVHINPTDTTQYLREFRRVLRPGGIAVIHHVGQTPTEWDYAEAFRAQMNAKFFAHLLQQQGLQLIEQNADLPHKPGDVISVFTRPE
jgi:ubiquinone/menaquinone biosynthesis C-methylase UbiE